MFQKIHLLWCQAHIPLYTEGLPETAPLWLSPPLGDKFCFAGSQYKHCDGNDHNNNQQQTQDPCTRFKDEIAKVNSLQPCTCKIPNWQQGKTPAITPQSGRRLSRCCLTTPCLTSCAGVIGWKTEARGSHADPSSLTTTTVLHCGTALSTNTYFPVSEKTWANLRQGEKQGNISGNAPTNGSSNNQHESLLALWTQHYFVELKFVCFMSICRRLKAPKSQLGLLLNRWSFWYTGKWLRWRSTEKKSKITVFTTRSC